MFTTPINAAAHASGGETNVSQRCPWINGMSLPHRYCLNRPTSLSKPMFPLGCTGSHLFLGNTDIS